MNGKSGLPDQTTENDERTRAFPLLDGSGPHSLRKNKLLSAGMDGFSLKKVAQIFLNFVLDVNYRGLSRTETRARP